MARSQSDALVVFGVTGDLAHKMIFPALYAMVKSGVLNVPVIETGLEGPSIVAFVGRSPQAWQSMRGHLCPPGSGRRSRGRSIRFPDPGLCELGAGVPRRTVRRRRLPGRPLHESTESTAAGLVRETDGGNSASSYQGRRS